MPITLETAVAKYANAATDARVISGRLRRPMDAHAMQEESLVVVKEPSSIAIGLKDLANGAKAVNLASTADVNEYNPRLILLCDFWAPPYRIDCTGNGSGDVNYKNFSFSIN